MNVFSWVNDYDDITNNKTFNGSLNLNWNINKYFSYSLRAGGNIIVNDRKRWYGIQLPPGENVKGLLAISNVNKSNYTVENLLNFNMDLTKDFRLSATAGITYDEYHFLTENVSGIFQPFLYKSSKLTSPSEAISFPRISLTENRHGRSGRE